MVNLRSKWAVFPLGLALLVVLSGCATRPVMQPPPAYDPALSLAMNVVVAGGLVDRSGNKILMDRSAPEWTRLSGAFLGQPGSSNALVSAGYAAANVLNPPPHFSTGAAGVMSVVSLLADLPVYLPGQADRLLAWLPADRPIAGAVYDANVLIRTTFAKIMAPGYTIGLMPGDVNSLGLSHKAWLIGPGCAERHCQLAVHLFPPLEPPPAFDAPSFIGSHQKMYGPVEGAFMVKTGRAEPTGVAVLDQPPFERLLAFSAALPEGMFVYLAPKAGRNPVPLILHQGQPLYFITPGEEVAAGIAAPERIPKN